MKIKSAEFIISSVRGSPGPAQRLPEIAFIGKSNVGKSSLLNTLMNRKNLAKTSSAPGKTRTINFYMVNKAFYLVDLPGYGYAKVPQAERRSWKPMVEEYLEETKTLKGCVVLLDIRREPGNQEQELYKWLSKFKVPVITVLTKADKLSNNRAARQTALIRKALSLSVEEMVLFSAHTGLGKAELNKRVSRAISDA